QGVTGIVVVPSRTARAATRRFLGMVTAAIPCDGRDRCRLEVQTTALLTASELRDPANDFGLLARFVASGGTRVTEAARVRYDVRDWLTIGGAVSQEMEHLGIDAPGAPLLRARRATSRASASAVAKVGSRLEVNA